MLRRLHRDESGFALVTAITLLTVMSLLMVVSISAGESTYRLTERSARWTRVLGVAEAGISAAVVAINANQEATPIVTHCPYAPLATAGCKAPGGEYQVTWQRLPGGQIEIVAVGFHPTAAAWLGGDHRAVARKVRAVYGPSGIYKYALFSETTLDVWNNARVIGDLFANESVRIGTNAVICGNLLNASGGVQMQNDSRVVKTITGTTCNSTASVESGDSISLGGNAAIEGNALSAAPSSTICGTGVGNDWAITGGSVLGTAQACGKVTSFSPDPRPYTSGTAPIRQPLPQYTWNLANYPGIVCFPSSGVCGPGNTSTSAVSQFNASVSRIGITGYYAVWQTNPTGSVRINLENIVLGGDLTVITNAPIDLGNTAVITTTAAKADLTLISLFVPPQGSSCSSAGGVCSIYGKNSVKFDPGDPLNPDDGVVALLYTPGKIAFKNDGNGGEGSLWGGQLDVKNGYDITYNRRVEARAGFGTDVIRLQWSELPP